MSICRIRMRRVNDILVDSLSNTNVEYAFMVGFAILQGREFTK